MKLWHVPTGQKSNENEKTDADRLYDSQFFLVFSGIFVYAVGVCCGAVSLRALSFVPDGFAGSGPRSELHWKNRGQSEAGRETSADWIRPAGRGLETPVLGYCTAA